MTILSYIIYFIGIVDIICILVWLYYTGIHNNSYRPFCDYWFKDIFNYRTYYGELKHYYERLRYGISWNDSWNLDTHIAKIIPRGLIHVRDSGFAPDISSKDWDDMIFGIENYQHFLDCSELDCPISHKQLEKDFNYGMMLFIKHYKSLWI